MFFHHIGVVGAGAWGTALAMAARRAGAEVTLWAREEETAAGIREHGENKTFLPGRPLDPAITATNDLGALAGAEAIFLAAPAQHTGAVAADLAGHIKAATPVLLCAKGIEQGSNRLMSEVVGGLLPDTPLAVLSGPTFAAEVADNKPAAAIIAGFDSEIARLFADSLSDGRFRPYVSDDPRGAQVGGAVKNVLAIGSGVVMGRGLGENARAALITRGLAEMIRFGVAHGGQAQTLIGLAGFGDLCLTCTSEKSRNTALGIALGGGGELRNLLEGRSSVAEGAWTAAAIADMAEKANVSMPICQAIDGILNHGADIDRTIKVLLARPLTNE